MATAVVPPIAPDLILSFEINPGTLPGFLKARAEGGPRLKCFEGSVTLVSPGMSHETSGHRLGLLIHAVCLVLGMRLSNLRSTTWTLPLGVSDTAYEADAAFYIQKQGQAQPDQPPDLAIEVVVSHPATKALWAAALLQIPELWVFDLSRHRLTFYHLATRGKHKGAYRPASRSRAFPFLTSSDVLEVLDDPETDDIAFAENCRAWARDVLTPRIEAENGGN